MNELYEVEVFCALELKKFLIERREDIRTLLAKWDDKSADCHEKPNCPRCVLLTELELLGKYISHLDRELWYCSHRENERS